ncbi:hypothetical protein VTK73DRAFT_4869 [Phialemonium thermophilum]|uniref:DNA mismatch repair proteins mutS family domain-containing protein n=1 Tax=Phialemonium thermophilum TaxID=223376 RepID=A0ABR3V785_9PEZI
MAIIDELGRGTSTRDGLAIALSIAEALLQSGALVFFATHFGDLGALTTDALYNRPMCLTCYMAARIFTERPGVLRLHLQTELRRTAEDVPKMTMLYKIGSGSTQEEHYGIMLAGAVGFPRRFLEVAENVSKALHHEEETRKWGSQARKIALRRRLVLTLNETLKQALESGMKDGALSVYMRRLQIEFIKRMDEIEGTVDEENEHVVVVSSDEENQETDAE